MLTNTKHRKNSMSAFGRVPLLGDNIDKRT